MSPAADPPALAGAAAGLLRRHPRHVAMAAGASGLAMAQLPGAAWLAAAAASAAVLSACRAPGAALAAAAVLLAGAGAGAARLHAIDSPGARLRAGDPVDGRAHMLARPRPGAFGESVEVRMASGRARGARLLARLPRRARLPPAAGPGAELALAGSVRGARHRQGSSFDFSAYLRRRGVAAELGVDRVRATGRRRGGVSGWVDLARARAERGIAADLPAPAGALVRGMVLGEDEAIDPAVREDFRASGLAHVLAVSGQNVMLLAALALPLLAAAGLSHGARIAVILGLFGLYVPLAGGGPSLQRAGVMGAASLVALAAARPASRSYALLLAACVTLAVNPRACGDPGWQLSFAAVAGILVLGPPLRSGLSALPPLIAEGLAVTVAATVATAPLMAHHFGAISLAALPANVLGLPLVAPIMWLGMLRAGLGMVPAGGPPGMLAGAAAALLGVPLGSLARALAGLASAFAEIPGSSLRLPLGSTAGLVGGYAALGLVAAGARRLARRTETLRAPLSASWRRLPRTRRVAVVCASAAAAALLLARGTGVPPAPDRLTVSFLDIGQGDATLVQHPDGSAVLFDGGPPEGRVARLLRRAGVRRLSAVVMTHQSRDHQGGLREVVERYPVDLLVDGGDGTHDPDFRATAALAQRRGARRVVGTAPLTVRAGALTIRVLAPAPRPPGPSPEDANPRGMVTVVSAGGFDLLLSADAESPSLAPLDLPDVDAMKVPHHGSADPGLPEVLSRLRPEMAAIEVGQGNSYGHPAPGTIAALRRARVPTYRTDLNGTVRLTVDRGGMRVRPERGGAVAAAP